MNDIKLNWSGYEWIPKERWGNIHPDHPEKWYDPTQVSIDENGILSLGVHRHYKGFPEHNIISPVGIGLVSCTHKFSYGKFSIIAKLPKGKNLWPAFWLYGWETWPPELDVFEAYSGSFLGYFKFDIKNPLGFWKVETNVHYETDKRSSIGGKTSWFGFKNPSNHFMKYEIDWRPDSIDFIFNDKIVRSITDDSILSKFRNQPMNVIINTSIRNLKFTQKSEFLIKEFKYEPLQ